MTTHGPKQTGFQCQRSACSPTEIGLHHGQTIAGSSPVPTAPSRHSSTCNSCKNIKGYLLIFRLQSRLGLLVRPSLASNMMDGLTCKMFLFSWRMWFTQIWYQLIPGKTDVGYLQLQIWTHLSKTSELCNEACNVNIISNCWVQAVISPVSGAMADQSSVSRLEYMFFKVLVRF